MRKSCQLLTNDVIVKLFYCPPLLPYIPRSPPPFPSLLPAFLRVFPKKSFLYPPCSCTYSLRDLNPTYISLFSYSTYQGAPVPKSLVNANQELKFYSRIVFTSLCIYVYPLLFCIVFVLPYIPVPFYISPLLPCMVLVLPYIPVPSTYTLYSLVCRVLVLPYIPVPFFIYPLLPCIVLALLSVSLWLFKFPLYFLLFIFS